MDIPCSLTLGVFDGVHLGHQHLLDSLTGNRVALTFSNHPLTVVSSFTPPLLMCAHHRIDLLGRYVDQVIVRPFGLSLAKLSPESFIQDIRKEIQFTRLILGHDAVLGYQRTGSPERLQQLSNQMGFELRYVSPYRVDNKIVSSRLIREYLQDGNLQQVKALLGRPYTIRGIVTEGQHIGQSLGFPTANLNVAGLALPPCGVYAVEATLCTESHPPLRAIANLGRAPTIHSARPLLLEVHILEQPGLNLYGQEIEVEFISFLRDEKKFASMDDLIKQITADVAHRLRM